MTVPEQHDGRVIGTWEELGPLWQECFRLAWTSFRAGSVPVGALVVTPLGEIVTRGRNRRTEPGGADGPLGLSSLAHAEVNALVTLPIGEYSRHVVYTTLEPCLLCTAALRQCQVGTVRFAGEDLMWSGIGRLAEINPLVGRWARREGLLGGPFRRLAIVLHLVWALDNGAQSIVDCHAGSLPDLVSVARGLAGPPAGRLREKDLVDALPLLLRAVS